MARLSLILKHAPSVISIRIPVPWPARTKRKVKNRWLRMKGQSGADSRTNGESNAHQTSRLLALPVEIRIQIWELAIIRNWEHHIDFHDSFTELYRSFQPFLCCRRLVNEARPYFEQSRDSLLQDTTLYITGLPSTSKAKHLKSTYNQLAKLTDTDLAKINSLVISSPWSEDRQSNIFPVCVFQHGYWMWWPSAPGSHNPHRLLHVPKEDWKSVHQMIPKRIGLRYIFWFGFNWPRFERNLFTFVLYGDVEEELMRELVRKAGSERVTRDCLKWVMLYRWTTRDGAMD